MNIQLSDHFNYSKLFRFTLPSVIMMMVTSVYSVVDGLFVSNLVGDKALAAVNIIFPLTMIVGAFGFMMGTGGSAEVARVMGTGEGEKAKEYFTTLILVLVGGGAAISLGCILFMRPLAGLLGASEVLMKDALTYGFIMLAGAPVFILQTSFQSFLVAAERPKMGLWLSIGAGLTNMALDYVFIALFRWGVAGAALATVSGYMVGGFIPLVYFLLPNKSPLRLVKTRLYPRMLWKSATNGSSELMTNVSASLVTVLYNRSLMNVAGETGVAAYTVMMYVDFIFVAAFIGFTMGVAPVFSFQYGAGNDAELKSLFGKCTRVIAALSLVMTAAPQFLAGILTGFFVGYDQALWEMTTAGFRVFALSFLFKGWNIFGSGFFTALGDGKTSAILAFLRTLLFQCGAILLLPMAFQLSGIWWATVAAEGAAVMVTGWYFYAKRKVYHYT
jgi:Na+-driven multidrug efflux pump